MKKYSLILFDMDGTIVDSDQMLYHSLYALYDKFNNGIRKPEKELVKYSGPLIEESLKKEFPNIDISITLGEYIKQAAHYSYLIKPMENIISVLKELKNKGVKTGIVTNKHTKNAIKALKATNMEGLFDILIGFDEVVNHKPAKDGILKAMELLNIKDKSEVLYVGDNNVDHYTAENAGVDSALINWGPRCNSLVVAPTYKIDKFDELLEVN